MSISDRARELCERLRASSVHHADLKNEAADFIEHALSSPPNVGEGVEGIFRPSGEELKAIQSIGADQELSDHAVMRQALRLYQSVHLHLKAGETMHFSGDAQRAAEFAGLSTPPHDRATIRREAFEEAAKVAVAAIGRTNEHLAGWNDACREIDRRINALKETPA